MRRKDVKLRRAIRNFYSFENYKPNKNAKPVMYNGVQYLSKVQCMKLEGLTRKELDAYLKNQADNPQQEDINDIIEGVDAQKQDIAVKNNEILDIIDDIQF